MFGFRNSGVDSSSSGPSSVGKSSLLSGPNKPLPAGMGPVGQQQQQAVEAHVKTLLTGMESDESVRQHYTPSMEAAAKLLADVTIQVSPGSASKLTPTEFSKTAKAMTELLTKLDQDTAKLENQSGVLTGARSGSKPVLSSTVYISQKMAVRTLKDQIKTQLEMLWKLNLQHQTEVFNAHMAKLNPQMEWDDFLATAKSASDILDSLNGMAETPEMESLFSQVGFKPTYSEATLTANQTRLADRFAALSETMVARSDSLKDMAKTLGKVTANLGQKEYSGLKKSLEAVDISGRPRMIEFEDIELISIDEPPSTSISRQSSVASVASPSRETALERFQTDMTAKFNREACSLERSIGSDLRGGRVVDAQRSLDELKMGVGMAKSSGAFGGLKPANSVLETATKQVAAKKLISTMDSHEEFLGAVGLHYDVIADPGTMVSKLGAMLQGMEAQLDDAGEYDSSIAGTVTSSVRSSYNSTPILQEDVPQLASISSNSGGDDFSLSSTWTSSSGRSIDTIRAELQSVLRLAEQLASVARVEQQAEALLSATGSPPSLKSVNDAIAALDRECRSLPSSAAMGQFSMPVSASLDDMDDEDSASNDHVSSHSISSNDSAAEKLTVTLQKKGVAIEEKRFQLQALRNELENVAHLTAHKESLTKGSIAQRVGLLAQQLQPDSVGPSIRFQSVSSSSPPLPPHSSPLMASSAHGSMFMPPPFSNNVSAPSLRVVDAQKALKAEQQSTIRAALADLSKTFTLQVRDRSLNGVELSRNRMEDVKTAAAVLAQLEDPEVATLMTSDTQFAAKLEDLRKQKDDMMMAIQTKTSKSIGVDYTSDKARLDALQQSFEFCEAAGISTSTLTAAITATVQKAIGTVDAPLQAVREAAAEKTPAKLTAKLRDLGEVVSQAKSDLTGAPHERQRMLEGCGRALDYLLTTVEIKFEGDNYKANMALGLDLMKAIGELATELEKPGWPTDVMIDKLATPLGAVVQAQVADDIKDLNSAATLTAVGVCESNLSRTASIFGGPHSPQMAKFVGSVIGDTESKATKSIYRAKIELAIKHVGTASKATDAVDVPLMRTYDKLLKGFDALRLSVGDDLADDVQAAILQLPDLIGEDVLLSRQIDLLTAKLGSGRADIDIAAGFATLRPPVAGDRKRMDAAVARFIAAFNTPAPGIAPEKMVGINLALMRSDLLSGDQKDHQIDQLADALGKQWAAKLSNRPTSLTLENQLEALAEFGLPKGHTQILINKAWETAATIHIDVSVANLPMANRFMELADDYPPTRLPDQFKGFRDGCALAKSAELAKKFTAFSSTTHQEPDTPQTGFMGRPLPSIPGRRYTPIENSRHVGSELGKLKGELSKDTVMETEPTSLTATVKKRCEDLLTTVNPRDPVYPTKALEDLYSVHCMMGKLSIPGVEASLQVKIDEVLTDLCALGADVPKGMTLDHLEMFTALAERSYLPKDLASRKDDDIGDVATARAKIVESWGTQFSQAVQTSYTQYGGSRGTILPFRAQVHALEKLESSGAEERLADWARFKGMPGFTSADADVPVVAGIRSTMGFFAVQKANVASADAVVTATKLAEKPVGQLTYAEVHQMVDVLQADSGRDADDEMLPKVDKEKIKHKITEFLKEIVKPAHTDGDLKLLPKTNIAIMGAGAAWDISGIGRRDFDSRYASALSRFETVATLADACEALGIGSVSNEKGHTLVGNVRIRLDNAVAALDGSISKMNNGFFFAPMRSVPTAPGRADIKTAATASYTRYLLAQTAEAGKGEPQMNALAHDLSRADFRRVDISQSEDALRLTAGMDGGDATPLQEKMVTVALAGDITPDKLAVMAHVLRSSSGDDVGALTVAELGTKLSTFAKGGKEFGEMDGSEMADALGRINKFLEAAGGGPGVQKLPEVVKAKIAEVINGAIAAAEQGGFSAGDNSWEGCRDQITTLAENLGVTSSKGFDAITAKQLKGCSSNILTEGQRTLRANIANLAGETTPASIKDKVIAVQAALTTNGTERLRAAFVAAVMAALTNVEFAADDLPDQVKNIAVAMETPGISEITKSGVGLKLAEALRTAVGDPHTRLANLRDFVEGLGNKEACNSLPSGFKTTIASVAREVLGALTYVGDEDARQVSVALLGTLKDRIGSFSDGLGPLNDKIEVAEGAISSYGGLGTMVIAGGAGQSQIQVAADDGGNFIGTLGGERTTFHLVETNGDGTCALHALLGTDHGDGGIRVDNSMAAREAVRDLVNGHGDDAELWTKPGIPELLEDIVNNRAAFDTRYPDGVDTDLAKVKHIFTEILAKNTGEEDQEIGQFTVPELKLAAILHNKNVMVLSPAAEGSVEKMQVWMSRPEAEDSISFAIVHSGGAHYIRATVVPLGGGEV